MFILTRIQFFYPTEATRTLDPTGQASCRPVFSAWQAACGRSRNDGASVTDKKIGLEYRKPCSRLWRETTYGDFMVIYWDLMGFKSDILGFCGILKVFLLEIVS